VRLTQAALLFCCADVGKVTTKYTKYTKKRKPLPRVCGRQDLSITRG
jgi:hypothetical protein